jgi:hypothetical protein
MQNIRFSQGFKGKTDCGENDSFKRDELNPCFEISFAHKVSGTAQGSRQINA